MIAPLIEVSLEGMPGPTHHFGGLAYGNLHAMAHAKTQSSPKRAALESLAKMALLLKLGVKIMIMPPQIRPNTRFLSSMGFRGSLAEQLRNAYDQAPSMFLSALSSASMWTANAATVTAAMDNSDGHIHITPANLSSQLHRAQETAYVTEFFRTITADSPIVVHEPLPATLADEGAANLIRFSDTDGHGHHLFAYGRSLCESLSQPQHFPARQTLEASQGIIRHHGLRQDNCLCVQQSPEAIDAGVFHQDVIAFGSGRVLVAHERAYTTPFFSASPRKKGRSQGASPLGSPETGGTREVLGSSTENWANATGSLEKGGTKKTLGSPTENGGEPPLGSKEQDGTSEPLGDQKHGTCRDLGASDKGETAATIEASIKNRATVPLGSHEVLEDFLHRFGGRFVQISEQEIPLTDLVDSYLCNGQIITSRENKRIFLVPKQCQNIPSVANWLAKNITRFADKVHYIPVSESLKNGGGPACLRLRMPLTEAEWRGIHPGVKLTPEKIRKLEQLVNSLYPDSFHPNDILETACLERCLAIPGEIEDVLGLKRTNIQTC
jgi:succinylarginine dihydrolase